MHLSVISPEKSIFNGDVYGITAQGVTGVVGILPGHEPYIIELVPGVLDITLQDGEIVRYYAAYGVMQVDGSLCSVVLDEAILESDLDIEIINSKLIMAEEKLITAASKTARHTINNEIKYLQFIIASSSTFVS